MTTNKGTKYINCKECGRKRYCRGENLPGYYYQWTCSKGHTWKFKVGPAAQIVSAELDNILPTIKDLFERDDLFLRALKRR